MVWATARRAPTKAYLEFEAHPEPSVAYTARLDKARINRILKFKSVTEKGIGIGAQRVRARVSASIGEIRNSRGDDVEGRMGSLIKSLTPSAIGWRRP